MKYAKVVFIDPGTTFGWAMYKSIGEKRVTSGAVTLDTEAGPRVLEFWERLGHITQLMRMYPLSPASSFSRRIEPAETFIAWEAAAFTGKNPKADRLYGTWEGLLILFCELNKIPYTAFGAAQIRAYAQEQEHFSPRKPRPRSRKGESRTAFKARLRTWETTTGYDRKPVARVDWQLTTEAELPQRRDEIDARWGLEFTMKKLNIKEP